jgi:catechol 2,3-dioxygenase-like lactoylglutathione lyase family enzyme
MLSAILAITLVVSDLAAVERAYVEWLGYRVVERSVLSADLAALWDAPAAAGSRVTILQPASGANTYLRLIERPSTAGFRAMATHGWNSNEILVEDPAALERRFKSADSPFRVVGSTAPLGSNSSVIAMQAIGPGGELNYFTRIPPTGGTFIKTPAQSSIDRTFIVVLGGPSMETLRRFYAEVLGMQPTEPYSSTVGVLQDALKLPKDAQTRIALVPISPGFLIELDEYPPVTVPRPLRTGDLPPGMAIVSFASSAFDARALPWVRPPSAGPQDALYSGRRVGVVRGAAGEWIELVETIDK